MPLSRAIALLALAVAPSAASAQQPKDEDKRVIKDMRVITNYRLSLLSFTVRQDVAWKLFKTDNELRKRLSMALPTDSVLVAKPGAAATDIVWYTDPAITEPKPIDVTRDEHTLLFAYAEGGLSRLLAMTAGPVTVTEMVTAPGSDGKPVRVQVFKTVVVMPSEDEVKSALEDIAKVGNADIRAALELAAGAKFAELFPPDTALKAPKSAVALADHYRKVVYDDAVKFYAAKPEDQLPPLDEPNLFGKTHSDVLSIYRAVEGAEPVSSFETKHGKFAAVWDNATLILVRQPRGADAGFPGIGAPA